jgi:hypothetical protein
LRAGWALLRHAQKRMTLSLAKRLGPALELFGALLAQVDQTVQASQANLRVVLLPGASFVLHPQSSAARYQTYLAQQIRERFANYRVQDVAGQMLERAKSEDAREWYFPNEGHLTQKGHRTVAFLLEP